MPAPIEGIDWEQVEKAAIAGVTYGKLAEEWGLEENAIRQRAWREKWAVPNRIKQLARDHGVTNCNEGVKNRQIARIAGDSLAEYGQRNTIRLVQYLEGKFQRAVDEDLLPEIDNYKALASATGVFRKELGLDKPQTNVQVNLWDREGYAQLPRQEREVDEWGE